MVKSMHKALDGSRAVTFSHWFIWNYWVPSKVDFFAWEAACRIILTFDML